MTDSIPDAYSEALIRDLALANKDMPVQYVLDAHGVSTKEYRDLQKDPTFKQRLDEKIDEYADSDEEVGKLAGFHLRTLINKMAEVAHSPDTPASAQVRAADFLDRVAARAKSRGEGDNGPQSPFLIIHDDPYPIRQKKASEGESRRFSPVYDILPEEDLL